ncbi:MAG: class I SAM-dependent methyltransferase [Vicinamibacterales bacterium]
MTRFQPTIAAAFLGLALLILVPAPSAAQEPRPFEPVPGQAGKDVVWVPTPESLVEKMLDMATVTARDVVMDLGSGDGRNVIAAARRGARAVGVEYNPEMVALSRRNAEKAGVAGRATFIEGDMFAADISEATVLALFLLPSNLEKLKDKFLALRPGTRIVLNTFGIEGWEPDATETVGGDCESWCTSLLLMVPARVDGPWRMAGGEVVFAQAFQKLTGSLKTRDGAATITEGRLRGEAIEFMADGTRYTGRVEGDRMEGTAVTASGASRRWNARRTGAR